MLPRFSRFCGFLWFSLVFPVFLGSPWYFTERSHAFPQSSSPGHFTQGARPPEVSSGRSASTAIFPLAEPEFSGKGAQVIRGSFGVGIVLSNENVSFGGVPYRFVVCIK